MKYFFQTLEAYGKLGFKPRDNQVEYVSEIVTAFLDEGYQNLILNAPTGTGKSIIAAVAAEVIKKIRDPYTDPCASFILMGTNVLAKQYADTFDKHEDFTLIKGANNYKCTALTDEASGVIENAESCAIQLFKENNMDDVIREHCWNCKYRLERERKNLARQLITNYSYFFVDRMYADTLEKRDITIWDEAHTLNDVFTEHNAIYFSVKRLKAINEEISESLDLTDPTPFNTFKKISADLKAKKVNDGNYIQYATALQQAYSTISKQAKAKADSAIKSFSKYKKLSKLYKKYQGLSCKIDDLLLYKYEHVFEFDEKEESVSIKPIFVGTMFEKLVHSEFNLFMSATVSERFLLETLLLDPAKTKFVKLPATFPTENKKIVFLSPINLNYKSLQEDSTKKQLNASVEKIILKHAGLKESGIILTPSFVLTESIASAISKHDSKIKIFEHVKGEKLEVILSKFKAYNKPAVLISPSLFEGIDLPGAMSRFQILVKAPFPSLAEKRMKFILEKHPEIYNLTVLMRIIQGAGRSVRSKDDWCITYALDQSIVRLWNSPQNVWKDEFSVNFSQFLM